MTPFQRRSPAGTDATLPDIVALADTDLLLDRLGDRSPFPNDLDDPLFAALAVLAADVDLDEVPPAQTRRTMTQHGLWPPQFDEGVVSTGRRVDVSTAGPGTIDGQIVRGQDWTPETRAQALAAEAREAQLRGVSAFVEPGRTVGIRLVPALAAAGAALVLSMGAAAALTKGESVNPAKAITQMVAEITGETVAPSEPDGDLRKSAPGPQVIQRSDGTFYTVTPTPGMSLSPSVDGLLPSPSVPPTFALSGAETSMPPLPTAETTTLPTAGVTTAPGESGHEPKSGHPSTPGQNTTSQPAPTEPATGPPGPSPAESSPPQVEVSPTPPPPSPTSQDTDTPAAVLPLPDAQQPPAT